MMFSGTGWSPRAWKPLQQQPEIGWTTGAIVIGNESRYLPHDTAVSRRAADR